MKEIIKYSDFGVELPTPEVLHFMDCYPGTPLYEEMTEEFEEIKKELMSLGKPQALFYFGQMPGEIATNEVSEGAPVVFVLLTEGGDISRYSTRMFAEGDYVRGMLADAAAGCYLFELDKLVMERLRLECGERGVGILRRMEAPADFPMEAQQIIFEKCSAKEELGMDISSGYMFDPVKSSGLIFALSDDPKVFHTQHDCRKCTAVNCKMRKALPVTITVREKEKQYTVECGEGQSVMDALIAHDRYFSAFCGGAGICGKCRVRVLKGTFPISDGDRRFFSEKEIQEGWRLACKAVPVEDCEISVGLNDEEAFEVVTSAEPPDSHTARETDADTVEKTGYGIACDIGTTTIALSLTGMTTGKSLDVYTTVNHQRMYGADVISRIQASNDGKGSALNESIQKDLVKGICELLQKGGITGNEVLGAVFAGNTTMGHLLMGYSCETLGVYPFTPVNIKTITGTCKEILGEDICSCPVTLMPGISTYVGADIVAGILSCKMSEREEISLLIDLGTNGEMAVGNNSRIMVTSTAAGPAFEGGNISCGMGSVRGAISGVHIQDKQAQITTIADEPPIGLCGTGVIETVAELIRTGLVDETGLLDEDLENGFLLGQTPEGDAILFTGKDVREVQLAKSAVRAGVETLLLRYGITYDQVDRVYLAGGFGLKINQDKAISIGMLPKEFAGKIEAVGNSSLSGAVWYLTDPWARAQTEKIVEISCEINLANDKDFNDLYMEHMFFDTEE